MLTSNLNAMPGALPAEDAAGAQADSGAADGPLPVTRNPLCGADTCDGCCVGGRCLRGTAQHTCGRGGELCAPCADSLSCIGGECIEGARESCNDADDDGDGDTDEGCDDDGDAYCDARMTTDGKPDVCALGGGDCDDDQPNVYPGAEEVCNGRDDDCNDEQDEQNVCADDSRLAPRPAHLPAITSNQACAAHSTLDRIYCFGGLTHSPSSASNEIVAFDPSDNAVQVLATFLATPRRGLSCVENSQTHRIYCFGGNYTEIECVRREDGRCVEERLTPRYLDEIVELDAERGRLEVKSATLPAGRSDLSCVEDSGTHKIYCFGGAGADGIPTDQIVEYDPSSDRLATKSASLPSALMALACAEDSQNHRAYCFGGYDGEGYVDSVVAYNPADDEVASVSATLPRTSGYHSCVEHASSHEIYCFAGRGARVLSPQVSIPYFVEDVIVFDPAGPELTVDAPKFVQGRHSLACAGLASTQTMFCFGGSRSVTFYDDIVEFQP
jgi:hypothetical protein